MFDPEMDASRIDALFCRDVGDGPSDACGAHGASSRPYVETGALETKLKAAPIIARTDFV